MADSAGRFHIAAQHYLQGRPAYSPDLVRRVAQWCGLRSGKRLLDLGCGPGQLAAAFTPFAGEVLGIDPEPEMLRIARLEHARATNVEFREGSSASLGPDLGSFHVVVIGRAFHWMDRADTLRRLDQIIEPEGSVVLFSDSHPNVPDNRWLHAYRKVIDGYAAGDPARAARKSPDWLPHEAFLLDSPFSYLERLGIVERRQTPLENLIHRALSMSSVSQAMPGTRAEQMAREVREAIAPFAYESSVTEVVESQALLARRTR